MSGTWTPFTEPVTRTSSARVPGPDEHEFIVGQQRFVLTMKTAGLIALQKHFNLGDNIAEVEKVFDKARQGSLEHATAIIWAAFQKYHPDVTFNQAIDLIDDAGGLDGIAKMFPQLAESTQPDAEDVKELATANPRKAQTTRGRGAPSRSRRGASV